MNPVIKATLIGTFVNLALSIIKFVGGVVGNSTAMISDAVHSASDVLTDGIVLLTNKISQIPKDKNHPYGHGRAETIGSAAIGLFILFAGIGLSYEAWNIIQFGSLHIPKVLAAGTALISIAANEWLFRYNRSIGEKSNSPSLVANAWHHRSDAMSSIAALIGIIGAMIGFPILDPIAAVVVALMVIKIGFKITFDGFRDLMDTSLSQEQIRDIQLIINGIAGVNKSHDLRTRKVGGTILIDVHIQVDGDLTVTEGHKISEQVRRKLINTYPATQDVLVHVDVHDDTQVSSIYTISRDDITALVNPIIANMNCGLKSMKLRIHHLNDKNLIELYLRADPMKSITETEVSLKKIKKLLLENKNIDNVNFYLEVGQSNESYSIK